jgi:hypothetical protein
MLAKVHHGAHKSRTQIRRMGHVRWFPNGAGEIKGETVFRYDLPRYPSVYGKMALWRVGKMAWFMEPS